MKIERLELYGYTRLLLNNIKHFTYTPEATYQLILGTNGSGKSSVLSELSPLPGHHSNFTKDGYKKVNCSHRGKSYVLTSIFKNNKHSFIVDEGEDLNPGGTYEVQRNLVMQHFGIDKDVHELLIGEFRLTQSSTAERRKWITRISRNDYGYAMKTFKNIASRFRDQQGVLRHLKQRLVNETQTLQSLGNLEGLEEKSHVLRNELNHLMLERQPNVLALDVIQGELNRLIDGVFELRKDYFANQVDMPSGKSYRSNEDIQLDVQRLDTRIQSEQVLLDRAGNEYNDLESAINSVQVEAGMSSDDLPGLISDQLRLIESLSGATVVFHNLNSPSEIQRDWNAVSGEVQNNFRQLPDNTDRTFTREAMQVANNDITGWSGEVDKIMRRIRVINDRLEQMREARETQCPSCNYIWKPGFSEQEKTSLQAEHGDLCRQMEALERLIADRRLFIEECHGYQSLYNQFRGFVQGYPRLQPLWDHILQNQLMLNNPQSHLNLFQQWAHDLETNVAYAEATRRLEHYREVQIRQNAIGDSAHFTRKMHSLQKEIEQRTAEVLAHRREREQVTRYFSKLQRLQGIAQQLEAAGNRIQMLRETQVDSLRNKVIDQTVYTHQTELAGIVRKISEKEGQEGIVKDLEASRVRSELDIEVLDILVQALSPNEGLIADQLAGDIGCMVAQLNSVINSIWTYDMEVLPCGLDSNELDYKFPVKFSTHANRTPDVSKTSKGQRQAIDLAFHLTVMLYLDLTDYPLFLDEPGEGFDEQHRRKLMDFVKQLMDSNRHSQLFMVSHYASGHGSFANAEVLVLDSSNISVPGVYNQHAVLA